MRLLALGIAVMFVVTFPRAEAQSLQPYLPASFYPQGSKITFDSDYTEQRMNAEWNFDAAGEPLMHTYPQHVFLRQSGWTERSWMQQGNKAIWFLLYDSTYGTFADGRGGNTEAFMNLRLMLRRWWRAGRAKQQPRGIVPAGMSGAAETRIIPKLDDGPFVVSSAWWGQNREIEGMAFTSPGLMTTSGLRRMLVSQIRYAAHLPETSAGIPATVTHPTR